MNDDHNILEERIRTLKIIVNRFWTFLAFVFIAYGSHLIHPGLVFIFLGFYIIKMTFQTDGLINVYISLPPIISPNTKSEPILDSDFIEKCKKDISNIIDEDELNKIEKEVNDIDKNNK